MNSHKLSDRLSAVASFIPKGSRVADIGSDHAYLPCYLVHQGIATFAVAGEVVKGPFESAVREVRSEGLNHSVKVRMGDGLDAVQEEDKIDVVTIAGMGGPLIASILERGKDKLQHVSRLVLQPNIHAQAIREWAVQNGWHLIDEVILKEDDKIYEVLVLEKGNVEYTEIEMMMGPFLIKKNDQVFKEKWSGELKQWKRIISSLQSSSQEKAAERKTELENLISRVEGVIGA